MSIEYITETGARFIKSGGGNLIIRDGEKEGIGQMVYYPNETKRVLGERWKEEQKREHPKSFNEFAEKIGIFLYPQMGEEPGGWIVYYHPGEKKYKISGPVKEIKK